MTLPWAAVFCLFFIFCIIVIIAFYLIIVGYLLYDVTFTLGTILIGVRAIAYQTEPVGEVLGGIYGDCKAIEGALGDLVADAGKPQLPARRTLSARRR